MNAAAGTHRPGQPDSVFVWLGEDFAFNDDNPPGIRAGLGGAVALALLGLANLRAAKPWKQLLPFLETAGEPLLPAPVVAGLPDAGRWHPGQGRRWVDVRPRPAGQALTREHDLRPPAQLPHAT